jgi:hypothetical protein
LKVWSKIEFSWDSKAHERCDQKAEVVQRPEAVVVQHVVLLVKLVGVAIIVLVVQCQLGACAVDLLSEANEFQRVLVAVEKRPTS